MSTPSRIFRWAGSKAHLVEVLAPALRAELAARGGKLVSLFYGSGVLERAVVGGAAHIGADANPDVRAAHCALLRHGADEVHLALRKLDARVPRTREGYAVVQSAQVDQLNEIGRAARFLWLGGLAFNGLWRVNRNGRHNVPPDPARLARSWPFVTVEILRAAATDAAALELLPDWRDALDLARPEDLVLADPPYAGGFVGYTQSGFPAAAQSALALQLRRAAERGCAVVAFNSPAAEPLYRSWTALSCVQRSGRISSRGLGRGRVREMIATAGCTRFSPCRREPPRAALRSSLLDHKQSGVAARVDDAGAHRRGVSLERGY
jgi:DNA adenine methylase